jgi:large subunit ribosomal protein L21
MFAVVQLGNRQFKVSEGETINAHRMDFDAGQTIVLDKVLLFSDGKTTKIGAPYLKDVEIKAEVVKHLRGPKTIAYQYRKRKDSARTVGHRDDLTAVRIAKISA